jgi:hypothetical protein
MIDASESITGQNLSAKCDYVFCAMHDTGNGGVPVFAKEPPNLKGGEIIFCKTDYTLVLKQVLNTYVDPSVKFAVLTHDSDFALTDYTIDQFDGRPICWAGMNCETKRALPVPIGIANSYCKITMKHTDFETSKNPSKLLYVNHRTETYPEVRLPAYRMFLDKPWATVAKPLPKGMTDTYKQNLLDHKFILCPRGNGVDTHRVWEALYCGVIPIVQRHNTHSVLEGKLPILFVDSYEEISESLLENTYNEYQTKTWNRDMLTASWWINHIKEKVNAY